MTDSSSSTPAKHDGATAQKLINSGSFLLDVRTPEEFNAGHIPGAVNIPVQELDQRLDEVKENKSIVVYCRSGRRSSTAKLMLEQEGHEVYDLGPMSAWPNADTTP